MAVSSIGGIGGEKYAGERLMDVWPEVWVVMVRVIQVWLVAEVGLFLLLEENDGCPANRKRSKNAPVL